MSDHRTSPLGTGGLLRLLIGRWLPVVLWMGFIFSASGNGFSAQHTSRYFEPLMHFLFPGLDQPTVEWLHFLFRKGCHLSEYALLAMLLFRALAVGPAPRMAWQLAFLGAVLFAASDEWHQTFMADRQGCFTDVLIDGSGAALGLVVVWLWRRGPPQKHLNQ